MPHITANGIRETTTTTGTGAKALSAVTGFERFADKCSVGDTVHGSFVAVDGSGVPTGEWERGIYTYTAANELTPTTVLESSNAGSAVNFSAGTKLVELTILAPNTSETTRKNWYRDLGPDALTMFGMFGDARDGNATISSGTTTLARDMFYNDLTISGTGSINTNGYIIRVLGTLNISAAPASAITAIGTNGGSTAATTAGAQPAAPSTGRSLAFGQRGAAGTAGATAAATQATAIPAATGVVLGGGAGTSASGGNGGNGSVAGSLGGFGNAGTAALNIPTLGSLSTTNIGTANIGGYAAGGGTGGSGDGTAGGGGGGSGNGGGVVWVYARKINRSGSTAAAAITARGGNGGNGGVPAGGNRGGGGGGGGAGGGVVRIVYETLLGSTATNALDASPGTGGNGGNGTGTGTGGGGGACHPGGVIEVCDIGNGTFTRSADSGAVVGGAASGTTGGTGASKTWRVSL